MRKTLLAVTMIAYALTGNARANEPVASYNLEKVVFNSGFSEATVYDSQMTATECGERLAAMPEPYKEGENIVAFECMVDLYND